MKPKVTKIRENPPVEARMAQQAIRWEESFQIEGTSLRLSRGYQMTRANFQLSQHYGLSLQSQRSHNHMNVRRLFPTIIFETLFFCIFKLYDHEVCNSCLASPSILPTFQVASELCSSILLSALFMHAEKPFKNSQLLPPKTSPPSPLRLQSGFSTEGTPFLRPPSM